jgi:Conserved domain frequently associated with peptide methionine sulfoxide reductase
LLLVACGILLEIILFIAKPQRWELKPTSKEGGFIMQSKDYSMPPLTPEEEAVIVRAGTERPFSGKYVDHHEAGVYICRRAERNFTSLTASLTPVAVGPASMTR